jgi:ABC-type transport system involved in cytochrome c biogenesis permease subunit
MELRSTLRIVGSLRFAAVVLVMLCIASACATVYEAKHGTPAALIVFYKSWWFEALLGLLGLNVLASMLSRYPWSRRHVGFLVTHASIIVILLGAWVTKQWGINGQAAIVEGQSAREFTTDQEALTIRKAGQPQAKTVDLAGGVGGIKPVTRPSTGPLEADGVRALVESYLPDSDWTERVTNDNAQPNLALEITLSSDGEVTKEWIFTDNPRASSISVRAAASPAEIDQFLTAPTTQPAIAKTVKLEIAGATFEYPLEQCMAGPVAVGQTGYSIKVLRYLPHALVGENKQLTSASDQPVNPAIEAEIAGPSGADKRYAFARFPEFGSMHGTQSPTAEVKLSFVAPSEAENKRPIEVVAGPQDRLAVRFNPPSGAPVRREVALGQTLDTPWPGMRFSVARRFENARRESVVQAVSPPRDNRVPAIAVSLQAGQENRQVWLRKHEPQTLELTGTKYELTYAEKRLPLGFEVRLNKFHLGTYPGTGRPRSFESHVTLVSSAGSEENRIISMNHPAKFGGYSLFQSSYQQSRSGPTTSVLSVSWDPGQPIVFGGYVTLIAGMLYVLVTRMRGRRKEDSCATDGLPVSAAAGSCATGGSPAGATGKQSTPARTGRLAAVGLVILVAFQPVPARAESAKLPAKLSMDAIRNVPVQHDGRWMPLDTVARDKVNAITGDKAYRGQDAVRMLLGWTFDPQPWMNEPLVTIGPAELRRELELAQDRDVFSYAELLRHQTLLDQIDHLSHRSGKGKMNPLESKVSDINEKLLDLQQVFRNQVIKPIPDAKSIGGAWQPITLEGVKPDAYAPVQAAWSDLKTAFLQDDAAGFEKAAAAVSAALAELPAAYRPTAEKIATELRYNRIRPYTLAWKLMAAGAVLAAIALFVQRRWFDAIAILGLMAGFAALSYGMFLRWQIAGRMPAANMFESLLFLSWGAGAFAIVAILFLKDRSVPLTASAIGALSLFLADTLPIDHFIRPIAPVLLDTVWMSIHVPGIMVSYAVLALAALIAHIQMIAMAVAPGKQKLIDRIDAMHYWYMHVGVILLGAGIITGSMWAAFSWGRYWGWDPKEVWSLIAFLAYLVIMHVRVDRERMPVWSYIVAAALGLALFAIVGPLLAPFSVTTFLALVAAAVVGVLFVAVRGQFASAFKSTVAFWFIIMTYIGVNYVLGIGLHSYGFGTGAVVHYMMLTGSIDLAIIGLLTLVYLARTRGPTGTELPVPAR